MKIIYYDEESNFGDELNNWLWPQIFGDKINLREDIALIGIGTILFPGSYIEEKSKTFRKKIIIGSGVRYLDSQIELDDTWETLFVRGPISQKLLNFESNKYITDSAYCLQFTDLYLNYKNIKKTHNISYMPHFKSNDKVDWKRICNKLNINYISPIPNGNIEHTLIEIAKSKYLITEAMHGAIVADIFRIPWKRVRYFSHIFESPIVSELKWLDWLKSMELKYEQEDISANYSRHQAKFNLSIKLSLFSPFFIKRRLIKVINRIDTFQLSKESIFMEKKKKLEEVLEYIKTQYLH